MTPLRKIFVSLAMLMALGMGPLALDAAAGDKIAVLVSSSEPPYEEALAGFQGYFEKRGMQADCEIYRLAGDVSLAEQAIQKIKKSGVRIIFTLGSLATEAAVRKAPDIPIVFGLVLRSNNFARASNATGVALEFPLETQLSWIKTMLPEAKTVGVLYNPKENKKRVEDAALIARRLGLRLDAFEVRTPQDIPSALTALSRSADVLWGIPDSLTLSSQMAKHILLFAFQNAIPFIGPSAVWVKAGALYSLDWDYRDVGAQCGDMAVQVLKGTPPHAISPATPRKTFYSINLKTAEQLKITIPDEIINKARNAY